MKASLAFLKRLHVLGVEDCFLVPGGAIMHLVDSLPESGIRAWPVHDERVATMAADGYARVKGKPALVLVSSGPGALNALNGAWGANVDSVPMIVVGGQVRSDTVNPYPYSRRQLGDQEAPTVQTKLVKLVLPAGERPQVADLAWQNAMCGRRGVVWVNWSVDRQACEVDYIPNGKPDQTALQPDVDEVREALEMLAQAQRPVIVCGHGIDRADCREELRRFVDAVQVPVVTSFIHDLLPGHPCWIGKQGTLGDRAGNLAAQRADLLLVLGCRMSIRNVTYDWERFSPDSKRIMVDVDPAELDKPTFRVDLPIWSDVKEFLRASYKCLSEPRILDESLRLVLLQNGWLSQCQRWREHFPTTNRTGGLGVVVGGWKARQHTSAGLDPYLLMSDLLAKLPEDVVVVTSDATAYIVTHQVTDGRHRMFSNSGCASMGYGIAAAIGAAAAGKRVLCVEGDGSIMQNLSALATIAEYDLPINVLVMCNGGYASIKATHQRMFGRAPLEPKMFSPFNLAVVLGYSTGASVPQPQQEYQQHLGWLATFGPRPKYSSASLDPSIPIEPRLESRVVDGKIMSNTLDHMSPEVEA